MAGPKTCAEKAHSFNTNLLSSRPVRAVTKAPGNSPRLLVTSYGSEKGPSFDRSGIFVLPSPRDSEIGTNGSLILQGKKL